MIKTETINREGETALIRTYSDAGFLIRQDDTGALYAEAVDVPDSGHTYTETDEPADEINDSEALAILIGRDGNDAGTGA